MTSEDVTPYPPSCGPATELHKDDDTSDQEVFKNELEEGENSGGLWGGTVGGTFEGKNYFLFLDTRVWYSSKF